MIKWICIGFYFGSACCKNQNSLKKNIMKFFKIQKFYDEKLALFYFLVDTLICSLIVSLNTMFN